MEKTETKSNPKFSNYIYILYKWRKFLIINTLIIGILAAVYALILPNQYRATATIMLPPDNQGSVLGGLSSILGGKSSIASMGSKLFGLGHTSEDVILGIINSRNALTKTIDKFDLMNYYEIDDKNMDKVIKAFKNDLVFEPNEFGMIDFSVINKDPKVSAEIANYMVSLVDSLNIYFNMQNAKNNRVFIEKRYLKNLSDLRGAEDSLYNFQKKYGIVAVPEQLEVTVKAAAEVEAQLTRKEMESYFMKQMYGEESPQSQGVAAELNMLKNKVQELKSSKNLGTTSNILFPFKEMPDIAIQYLRAYREVEIQQTVLEFVMPMYEQAKVEEQKSMPTIMIIDKADPPQLKYSPKRSAIVIGLVVLFLFLFIPLVFWGESVLRREKAQNQLEVKELNFFSRVIKIYKIQA